MSIILKGLELPLGGLLALVTYEKNQPGLRQTWWTETRTDVAQSKNSCGELCHSRESYCCNFAVLNVQTCTCTGMLAFVDKDQYWLTLIQLFHSEVKTPKI